MREITTWTERIGEILSEVVKETGLYYYREPGCSPDCCMMYTLGEYNHVRSGNYNPDDDPGTLSIWTNCESEGTHTDGWLELKFFPSPDSQEGMTIRTVKESWLKSDDFKELCKECARIREYDEESKEFGLVLNNIITFLDMVVLE